MPDYSTSPGSAEHRGLDLTSNDPELAMRSRHKMRWFLKAGYNLDGEAARCDLLSKNDLIRLFSSVTENEMSMTAREFYAAWSDDAAAMRKAMRLQNGHIKLEGEAIVTAKKERKKARIKKLVCQKCGSPFESLRRSTENCPKCRGLNPSVGVRGCASGNLCLRADRMGTPAPAASGKQYCSEICRDSDKARWKRSLRIVNQAGNALGLVAVA